MVSRKLDMGKLRGKFKVPNLQFVSLSDVEVANELRIHYEIGFAIGLTLLGISFNNSNISLWVVTFTFLLFGLISLIRYLFKVKSFRKF